MHGVDVAILAAFVFYALGSGLTARKRASRDLEQYFLAGRSLPGWKAGLSMAATQFAADTPLVVMGTIAVTGIFGLWQLWIYALAFLLMGLVLAPSWRRVGVLTDAELTEVRYGHRPAAVLRAVKALYLGTVFNCVVLAMVLLAATTIAEPFLLWHQWLPAWLFEPLVEGVRGLGLRLDSGLPATTDPWVLSTNNLISVLCIVSVTAMYSATGGLRSVVNTDVAQLGIMLVGTLAYAVWLVSEAGGLSAMHRALADSFAAGGPAGMSLDELLAFEPSRARDASGAVLAAFGLQWLLQINADGTGYLAQRSMACRTDDDARKAALWFTVTQVLVRSLLWIPIGLGLLVVFPPDLGADLDTLKRAREASYVRGMHELLPPGLLGLLLTGMLAALASTVDTHLNWGASYWTNDLYARFLCRRQGREPSGRELVWVARAANVAILLISLAVMTQLSSIRDTWQTSLLLGAGIGPLLVLRWLWWRMNAWGEIATIVSSLIALPVVWALFPGPEEAMRLVVMGSVATTAGIVAALVVGPEDRDRLVEFYRRARPPGFWGPIAAAAGGTGDDARRLGRGGAAVAVTALSLFCLLVAVGSLIAQSPPPTWLPSRPAWIGGLLVAGVALAPVAWRLGFRDSRAGSRES